MRFHDALMLRQRPRLLIKLSPFKFLLKLEAFFMTLLPDSLRTPLDPDEMQWPDPRGSLSFSRPLDELMRRFLLLKFRYSLMMLRRELYRARRLFMGLLFQCVVDPRLKFLSDLVTFRMFPLAVHTKARDH